MLNDFNYFDMNSRSINMAATSRTQDAYKTIPFNTNFRNVCFPVQYTTITIIASHIDIRDNISACDVSWEWGTVKHMLKNMEFWN